MVSQEDKLRKKVNSDTYFKYSEADFVIFLNKDFRGKNILKLICFFIKISMHNFII